MTGHHEHRAFARIAFKIAQKTIDLALRRGRQARRVEREVGAVLHVDDDLALQTKVRDCAESAFGFGIHLAQTPLELAQFPLNAAHPAVQAGDLAFGLFNAPFRLGGPRR